MDMTPEDDHHMRNTEDNLPAEYGECISPATSSDALDRELRRLDGTSNAFKHKFLGRWQTMIAEPANASNSSTDLASLLTESPEASPNPPQQSTATRSPLFSHISATPITQSQSLSHVPATLPISQDMSQPLPSSQNAPQQYRTQPHEGSSQS